MISANALLFIAVLTGTPSVELYEFTADWCGSCQKMQPTIEQLATSGVAVRQVNIDQHQQLAQRAGVELLPTFLAVSEGQILGRIVGATTYDQLSQLVTQAQRQVAAANPQPPGNARSQTASTAASAPYAIVRGQDAQRRKGIGHSLSNLMDRLNADGAAKARPADPIGTANSQSSPVQPALFVQADVTSQSKPRPRAEAPLTSATKDLVGSAAVAKKSAVARAIAATVRLRVKDETGVSLGTGTIVDIHEDEALVLTCGHIFEDSDGQGAIYCDFFAENGPRDVLAKLISYDVRRDVGLVSVRPGTKIQPASVAGPGYRPRQSDTVFSIGCNHGEDATVNRNSILAVNRYHGPANLVVGGRPVNGRSGGGLFSTEGLLIGVCNAADQEEDEGLYAALGPIHAELDTAGLGFIYRRSQQALAQVPSATPRPARREAMESRSSQVLNEPPGNDRVIAEPNPIPAGSSSSLPQNEDAEVICIVRPRNPDRLGQAYVLEDPSTELLDQLSQELGKRGPHLPTQSHFPAALPGRHKLSVRGWADQPQTADH